MVRQVEMSVDSPHACSITWLLLTMGSRSVELRRAVESLAPDEVVVVANGAVVLPAVANAELLLLSDNAGVPGGRDAGVKATISELVGFLDDDAELRGDVGRVAGAFSRDPKLGAVAFRLIDEEGETARRHIPRFGGRDPQRSGEVALFLGGACAIRREAYDQVGGYFTELFYGHEELELSWRLVDAGWKIKYLADVEVFHPRTTIERHADGWELTGRNRILIARRTLPWPVAAVHVLTWLLLGAWRAPGGASRRAYLRGWCKGWSITVDRRPISWRGIWNLTRLGRPPLI